MSWCDRCELPKAHCEHGLDRAVVAAFDSGFRVPATDLVADGPTISATQVSPCAGCSEKIQPDERITHTPDGWAHERHVGVGERDHSGNDVDWSDFT